MDSAYIKDNLTYVKKTCWNKNNDEMFNYAEGYKKYLDRSKTERRAVETSIALAKAVGFKDLEDSIKNGTKLYAGDRVYVNNQNKSAIFFVIGTNDITEGMNVTAAHVDSPRLDLKINPVFEDGGMCYLKTHYYGGIKKYQWTATPLSLIGTITTKDGKTIKVDIGEDENDPIFYVSDLLVHLASDQMAKTAANVVTGEQLNLICGSIPMDDEEASEKVKYNVLKILSETYGICEEDFLYAEIEAVPSQKAKDIGFDRGLIAAYGHDDKVCAYPALTGLFGLDKPERTCACILADKEEIGSVGSTGLVSYFFDNYVAEVINLMNGSFNDLDLRRALRNTYILSMDVGCGYDPNFAEAFDKQNSAIMGSGVILTKYTGSRGKGGSNDAGSEYLNIVRKAFEKYGVGYQTAELGKVDQGGGGTVASELSRYGCMTVDFGVPVLSMHAPVEVISKADLYTCFEGAKAFYLI